MSRMNTRTPLPATRQLSLLRLVRATLASTPGTWTAGLLGTEDLPGDSPRQPMAVKVNVGSVTTGAAVSAALHRAGLVVRTRARGGLLVEPPVLADDRSNQGEAFGVEDGLALCMHLAAMGIEPDPRIRAEAPAEVVVDGTQYAPSWRALPGGSVVDGLDPDERDQASRDYEDVLDAITDSLALWWEDGCLWVGNAPDDVQPGLRLSMEGLTVESISSPGMHGIVRSHDLDSGELVVVWHGQPGSLADRQGLVSEATRIRQSSVRLVEDDDLGAIGQAVQDADLGGPAVGSKAWQAQVRPQLAELEARLVSLGNLIGGAEASRRRMDLSSLGLAHNDVDGCREALSVLRRQLGV